MWYSKSSRIQTIVLTHTQARKEIRMNFFVVYSIVLIMVATTSGENKVTRALVGVKKLSVGYKLEVMARTRNGKLSRKEIQGSIDVSTKTVVEYEEQVGLIVSTAQLLQGVDKAAKLEFPALNSDDIQGMSVVSIQQPDSSFTPPQKFECAECYSDHVYLVDLSEKGIPGDTEFKTYSWEANHKSITFPNKTANTSIVYYEGKLCARIYLPYAKDYTLRLFPRQEGVEFVIKFEEQVASGLIVVQMKAN